MKCGHLFNGIGGFALAAHWMGWENVMHCEIDPFCNRVMAHHFPKSRKHEDIRNTDFSIYRGMLNILTGGFPCQPYSTAGKRKGKEDERHLWPEMLRAIREILPSWVVGENVRGIVSWNGGMVFDEVQADLEAAGYEVLPFLLPAAGVNAPHRRDRVWFVAYANGGGFGANNGIGQAGCQKEKTEGAEQWEERDEVQRQRDGSITGRDVAEGTIAHTSQFGERQQTDEALPFTDGRETWFEPGSLGGGGVASLAGGEGLQEFSCGEQRSVSGTTAGVEGSKPCGTNTAPEWWQDFPTQSPLCPGNDGLPAGLVPVSVLGRRGRRTLTEKQALSRIRKESLKAAGNAIVPQVAYQIFKAIEAYNQPNP